VQELQKQYGKDRFEVVLLSVDSSYGQTVSSATQEVKDCLKQHGIDWPAVVEPEGWTGVGQRLNVDGYSLVFIDTQGIVQGVDLRAAQVKPLLEKALSVKL
jgi:hypothetical protein